MSFDWNSLTEQLSGGDRFLITSHVRPDCDALGSELGLARILESTGKETVILNADPTPANIAFIDPHQKIKTLGVDYDANNIPAHDVLVVVDTSAWVQLGAMAEVMKASTAAKIVIDHHVSSDDLGAAEFKDVQCEATGRLVAELAEQLGVGLTPEISTPLLAALMTDTGWLRFSSVNAGSYETAAKLVAGGASPTELYGQLYERETLAENILRGRVALRLAATADQRIIYSYALNEDFDETGAPRTATESCVNQGLRIATTEATFFLVEQDDKRFKISFRSRGKLDCSQVAEAFGGGGHKAAAGAFTNAENVEDAIRQVLAAMQSHFDAIEP
jgi:phosphoesterase RecJ-like protein